MNDDSSDSESEGDAYRAFAQGRQDALEAARHEAAVPRDTSMQDLNESFANMSAVRKPGQAPPRKKRFQDMKNKEKNKRLDLIRAIESNWSCKIRDALPKEIAPRVASSHAIEHKAQIGKPDREREDPADWGVGYLRWLAQYSELTKGRHEEAVGTLVEFVEGRQEEDGGVSLNPDSATPFPPLLPWEQKKKQTPKKKETAKLLKNARELTSDDLRFIVKREDHQYLRKRKERIRLQKEAKQTRRIAAQNKFRWAPPPANYSKPEDEPLQPSMHEDTMEGGEVSVGQVKEESTVPSASAGKPWGSEDGLMHPSRRAMLMGQHEESVNVSSGPSDFMQVTAGMDVMTLSDNLHPCPIKQEE